MRNFRLVVWMTFLTIILSGCENSQHSEKIVVEEKFGLSRNLEYVKVTLSNYHEKELFLEDSASGDLILAEKLNAYNASIDSTSYIFPISIEANEKRTFYIVSAEKDFTLPYFKISGKDMSITVENEYFEADFSITGTKSKMGLFPGQLAGIFIKNRDVLLKRGHINMHWAPNFQKEGRDYKTIGHANLRNAKISQNNSYMMEMTKRGRVVNYEEIDLFGQYNFYAGLPYFEYTSTMTFNEETELTLLRNDEMTIDSLFTHLVYPNKSGEASLLPLYDMVKFDSLTKAPLAHDINWIGFINKPLNYGLISLRLEYDNRNLLGIESPLYQEHTKISASSGNGRYWNRRLINEHKTHVPKGSKYHEKNAYLVIDDLDNMERHLDYYMNRLKKPIEVSYSTNY